MNVIDSGLPTFRLLPIIPLDVLDIGGIKKAIRHNTPKPNENAKGAREKVTGKGLPPVAP